MLVTAQAPGKLFLIGEYAITFPFQSAVAFAVDKYVTVTAEANDTRVVDITSDQLGNLKIPFEHLQKSLTMDNWQLVKRTIAVLYQYYFKNIAVYKGLKLNITSDLTFQGKKLGLGSSAAVVIALIKAFNKVFNLKLSKQEQFKLGAIVMLTLPQFSKGSMADVAVATYGDVLSYRKFDDAFVKQLLTNGTDYATIMQRDWPGLDIKILPWPDDWQIAIGWTKTPADTQAILNHVMSSEKIATAKEEFVLTTKSLIDKFISGLENNDFEMVSQSILLNAINITNYTNAVAINYLTDSLTNALNIANALHIPAKISGAGGGDNVIAITTHNENKEKLQKAWQRSGIIPLPLHIATLGE